MAGKRNLSGDYLESCSCRDSCPCPYTGAPTVSSCTGCCWASMPLMFAGGVMDLSWMAGLTRFILLEKVISRERLFNRLAGALLSFSGITLIIVDRLLPGV